MDRAPGHRATPDRPHCHRPRSFPSGAGQRELILGTRQDGQDGHRDRTPTNLNPVGTEICGVRLLCYWPAPLLQSPRLWPTSATRGDGITRSWWWPEGNDPPGLAYIAPYGRDQHRGAFHGSGRRGRTDCLRRPHPSCPRLSRAVPLASPGHPDEKPSPATSSTVHSRLLERATHLRTERRATARSQPPIIETRGAEHFRLHSDQPESPSRMGRSTFSPSLF